MRKIRSGEINPMQSDVKRVIACFFHPDSVCENQPHDGGPDALVEGVEEVVYTHQRGVHIMDASLTKKIPTSQAVVYIVVALLFVGWVGYDKVMSPAPSQPGFDYSAYKPEAVIKFTAPAMGCVSKPMLEQASKYIIAHASTKLRGMFEAMECVSLDQKSNYKVLQNVDDVLEVVPTSSDATNGLWANYGPKLTAIVKASTH